MGLAFAAQIDGGFTVKSGWMQITDVTPDTVTFKWHPHQIGWECIVVRKIHRTTFDIVVVTPHFGFTMAVNRIDWPSGWVHVQIVAQRKVAGKWEVVQHVAGQRWFLPVQRF